MKKGIIVGLFLIFIAPIANANDVLWGSITDYASTKANKTTSVSSVEPILAMTTASTCKIYLNDTLGTGVTMAANVWYTIKVPSNITSAIFSCTSSTGTTVTVIK